MILRNISGHPSHVRSYDESPEARNRRYAPLKRAALAIAKFLPPGSLERDQVERCGRTLVYRWWLNTDARKLHAAYFCGKPKLCPFCAHRRAVKLLASYQARLALVLSERANLVPIFATFTVRNQAELLPVVKLLDRSFSTLIQRRQRQLKGKRTTRTCLARIAGGVAMIEVSKSAAGWHPHLHVLMLRESWITQAELLAEWEAVVGDQAGVDLRALRSVKGGAKLNTAEGIQAMGQDLVEVFKYSLKFSSMQPADVVEAESILRRRRMARPFGALWGVKEPTNLTDDLEGESGPYIESLYRWIGQQYALESIAYGTTDKPLWEAWKP